MATDKLKLKVELSLCKNSGGTWWLYIEDSLSSVRIMEIEISYEQFSRMFNSNSEPVDAVYSMSPRIGKRREHKEVLVPLHSSVYTLTEAFWELAQSMAGEGWELDKEKFNGHRYKDGFYRVFALRWV